MGRLPETKLIIKLEKEGGRKGRGRGLEHFAVSAHAREDERGKKGRALLTSVALSRSCASSMGRSKAAPSIPSWSSSTLILPTVISRSFVILAFFEMALITC